MNFLQKQNYFRPLFRAGVPWDIAYQVYYEYIRGGMQGPKYPGLNIANDLFGG